LKALYNYFYTNKQKDKLDMILEPLQSMIQLCLLSKLQIGSKLTIKDNILNIQNPNVIQPVLRWYNSDKKDDLFFLFQVIQRFIKWYNPAINKKSNVSAELYQLIISMATEGLNNLLKTYTQNDSHAVIQVINMYKNLLETNLVNENKDKDNKDDEDKSTKTNIDEVFENITIIYNPVLITIIHNSLLLINAEQDDEQIQIFITGLNFMLSKVYKDIREWIKVNLVF
jgi:hypothetical protein